MKLHRRIKQLEVRLTPPAPQPVRMSREDIKSMDKILERVWNERHDGCKNEYAFVIDTLRKEGFKGKPQRSWFKVRDDED